MDARCRQNWLKTFGRKRRNPLAFAGALNFPADEVGHDRQASAAQFFIRLQIKQSISAGRANPNKPAALVVQFDVNAPLKEWPVHDPAILLPVDDAYAPHQLDWAFAAAYFEKLEDFVQSLIETYRPPPGQFGCGPLRPGTRNPDIDRRRDFRTIFKTEFKVKTRWRIIGFVPLSWRVEHVVGPHFSLGERCITLGRRYGNKSLSARLG